MKILYLIGKIMGVFLMITAFLTWITYDYPEYNVFRFGGGSILDLGLSGSVGLMINWLLVVLQAAIGWFLFNINSD